MDENISNILDSGFKVVRMVLVIKIENIEIIWISNSINVATGWGKVAPGPTHILGDQALLF